MQEITRKAAAGAAEEQFKLGKMYWFGTRGTPQSYPEAIRWLEKSAHKDHSVAQFYMSQACNLGRGVAKNPEEGLKWLDKAADNGSVGAQYTLGRRYSEGDGLSKDLKQAFQWYRKAAEQGLAEAQFVVALCYARGDGIDVDDQKAVQWFRKAANQGFYHAQAALARRCAAGEGTKVDNVEAYQWFSLAREEKQKAAVAKKMSNAEIAEAEAHVKSFSRHITIGMDDPPRSSFHIVALTGISFLLYGGVFYLVIFKRQARSKRSKQHYEQVSA